MQKFLKIIRWILRWAVILFVAVIICFLSYRAYRQHVNAQSLAINTPNGIDESRYLKIGGIDQWVQIRGRDRGSPVLLCLHGGPGASWLGQTKLLSAWEQDFVVVQWDQRGTSKTLEKTGPSIAESMSVERMAHDGLELSEFLRDHLHKKKIVLLGFSWGSLLGVHMVKERPDLFYAYVGTGQISNMPKAQQMGYEYALQRARAANDAKAVKQLQNIGPPPFDNMSKIATFFETLGDYECESDRNAPKGALFAPNLSLWDLYNLFRGFAVVPTYRVYHEMLSADLSSLGPNFDIPVFFFQGTLDQRTPASLAKDYLDSLHAPRKEFVPLEGAGHFAVWTTPDKFLDQLREHIRPLAVN